ncbi:MAG: hypothetical protein Q8R04_00480 [Nanoarchaeota archaeon]|nr:hypothetical protein [Nanoarchaeota archaeon]
MQDKDLKKWIGLNPPFKNIVEKLKNLNFDNVFIITSKDGKSVEILMKHYGIKFPEPHILDNRILDKIKKLRMLNCPLDEVHFVDDIYSNLAPIKKATPVKCYLAVWGYNNEIQRREAEKAGIELLDEGGFGELLKDNRI